MQRTLAAVMAQVTSGCDAETKAINTTTIRLERLNNDHRRHWQVTEDCISYTTVQLTHSHRHSLNNPSRVAGSGVVTGHGGYAQADGSVEANETTRPERRLGGGFRE